MKKTLLYEFGVIMAVTFSGEICHGSAVSDPGQHLRPSSDAFWIVYEDYQTEQVKVAGDFLLDIMPPMFIPAGVGLLTACNGSFKPVLVPVLVITVVVTVFVMVVTGRVSQRVIWMTKEKEGEK